MSNIEQSCGKAQAEGEVSSSGILLPIQADHITSHSSDIAWNSLHPGVLCSARRSASRAPLAPPPAPWATPPEPRPTARSCSSTAPPAPFSRYEWLVSLSSPPSNYVTVLANCVRSCACQGCRAGGADGPGRGGGCPERGGSCQGHGGGRSGGRQGHGVRRPLIDPTREPPYNNVAWLSTTMLHGQ